MRRNPQRVCRAIYGAAALAVIVSPERRLNMMRVLSGFLCALFIGSLCGYVLAVEVETVTKEVVGTGPTLKAAVANGLLEAIGQIAGRFLEVETEVHNLEATTTDGADEQYIASSDFNEKIRSATKGAVKEYDILEQTRNADNLVEARLSVTCFKVLPYAGGRKRLVCASFEPESSVANAFTDALEEYLIQSRKFMVLNRAQVGALAKENAIILGGGAPVEDVLKVTTSTPADIVVVGNFDAKYSKTTEKMRSGRSVEIGHGKADVSYRVIDVISKQHKYGGSIHISYADKDLSKLDDGFTAEDAPKLMAVAVAHQVGRQILDAIYPLKVEIVTSIVTLDEGGQRVQVDQEYEVYATGDEVISSRTSESLGREEKKVGKIKIIKSNSKLSTGRIIEEDKEAGGIVAGCICRLSPPPPEEEDCNAQAEPGQRIKTENYWK